MAAKQEETSRATPGSVKRDDARSGIMTPTSAAPRDVKKDADGELSVHFLDVGEEQYGDSVLCVFGDTTVLIDGAHPGNFEDAGKRHPSIPSQVAALLGQVGDALHVSLLICTHCHLDHIGCLPAMVQNGLTADWVLLVDPKLGWGKTPTDAIGFAGISADAARVASGLREEPLSPATDTTIVERFLSDAMNLETKYTQMVEQLERNGSRVVRYGRPESETTLKAMLKEFSRVGLKILGPSIDHLLLCANLIKGRSKTLTDMANDALRAADAMAFSTDAPRTARAYRQALNAALDALDAGSKDKGAINDQSIVTRFEYRGEKLLFTGDMQLSEPEVSDQRIVKSMAQLRAAIKADGPYALVKLAHHGSYNGFSEEVLEDIGGALMLGICAGEGSASHPNPATLEILQAHRKDLQWVRTDHNGACTFTLNLAGDAEFQVTRGRLNDARPNATDTEPLGTVPAAPVLTPATSAGQVPVPAAERNSAELGLVALMSQLLGQADRVSVTITAERGQAAQGERGPRGGEPGRGDPRPFSVAGSDFRIAGGRALPALVFVTNQTQLAANIGTLEASQVVETIRNAGHELVDVAADDDPKGSAQRVRNTVRARASRKDPVRGVVILGGYDVVPSRRLDCLPPRLRAQVRAGGDPDDFVVWNDDVWGDLDGDELPEFPVSRIPDGRSAALVMAALGASGTPTPLCPAPKAGIRNVARPFAEGVFHGLGGTGFFLASHPTAHDQSPPYDLCANRLYLMLHGSDQDGTRFWGETDNGYLEAVGSRNIASWRGDVVFTGCCWGALPVDTTAARAQPGRPLGARAPGASLALQFLKAGARAFVGCTGAHYSPTDATQGYNYFGGPMHRAFWAAEASGESPSQALLTAKMRYMRDMPHGQTEATAQAIEFKILWEYTCLGLGW